MKKCQMSYFLTTKQKNKIKNTFANNLSTDLKLNKEQMSKIILLGGFLGILLHKIACPLMKVAVRLTKMF